MRYLPFLNGVYSVAPALKAMQKAVSKEDALVFAIDDEYLAYINNKKECRKENIYKYHLTNNFDAATEAAINQYIIQQLIKEYPQQFSLKISNHIFTLINHHTQQKISFKAGWLILINKKEYTSLFDALCSQLQEDAAVCCIDKNGCDRLAAVHICAPNYWAPEDKIGRPFNAVHQPVPGMEKNAERLFKAIVKYCT